MGTRTEGGRIDDATLLRQAAAGIAGAMDELYRRHGSLARHRAFLVLRDAALAEDAVQEAFLDLWRGAARFDARRAPLPAWLCVLVHRRSVDLARKEARRREVTHEVEDVDPASYTAEELLILQLERREVRAAVDELPEGQRSLVELAYYGGFSQSQLAKRFGIPLGTVKSRMHAALAALGAALAQPVPVD
jgi:RNA polymerase sigma factor (sigma-70 family)